MARKHEANRLATASQERAKPTGAATPGDADDARLSDELRTLSLNTLAEMLDTTRSSARRWFQDAGIRAVVLGRGRKAAIRYRWSDIKEWLESREHIE